MTQPRYCRPCKDAGIDRIATRILSGIPCCTKCASERWKPAGYLTPIRPVETDDEGLERVLEMRGSAA